MMETPNLQYINSLSDGDESVKKTLIEIIKKEFPEEESNYYTSLKNKNFKEAENNVHKIKHKISILGLHKSYEVANEYEHNLRETHTKKAEEFKKILEVISSFLKTI